MGRGEPNVAHAAWSKARAARRNQSRIDGVAPTVILPSNLANARSWRLFSGVKIINNILVQVRVCSVPSDYSLFAFWPNFEAAAQCSHPRVTLCNQLSGANSGAKGVCVTTRCEVHRTSAFVAIIASSAKLC